MALATHRLQGSCGAFHSVSYPSPWSRGGKVKYCSPSFLGAGRRVRLITLKCRSHSSVGGPLILGPKPKPFKISAFKGGIHDDSGDRANSSKSVKNPVKVTYFQHGNEESSAESSKVQNVVPSPFTVPDETRTRSLAIQNLFRKWLVVLLTPLESQPMERHIEEPSSMETSEVPKLIQKEERGFMKSIWCSLMGLDATIIIPILIFMPMYLGVNLVYGSEVSKELTPLWIIGPFIVALYVKMFRAICSLYVFSFWQTIKVVRNLPVYYMLVYEYLIGGKLKEAIRARLFQPLLDIKNMDYKEVTRKKMKDLQEWLVEKYLDFVESIWPYYCRTIRFLKRANLI